MISIDNSICLDLGSGSNVKSGYVGLDLRTSGVDVFGKLPYSDNSVSKIWASHILEHESHRRTVEVLQEWRRVLVPNGIIEIVVPNLYHDSLLVIMSEILKRDTANLPEVIFAHQDYEYSYHKTAFTKSLIRSTLIQAGFRDVKVKGVSSKVRYGINRKKYGLSHLISAFSKPELYAIGAK